MPLHKSRPQHRKPRSVVRQRRPELHGPFVIILGPQGAGKGTQAGLLAKKYGLEHIEMGGMLRTLVRRRPRSALAQKVARYMNEGKLAPFSVVVALIHERIRRRGSAKGIVFDGFPRHMQQARALLRDLRRRYATTINLVFLITISRAESIRRLSRRVVCSRCHRSWTLGKDVASVNTPCPFCGGRLYQRPDDQPVAIAKRLALYQKDTRPVAQFFAQRGVLHRIRGEQPIRAVFAQIDRAFRAWRKQHERP